MKSIFLSIILTCVMVTPAFAGADDLGKMVAGQTMSHIASRSGTLTYTVNKSIGGPLGRIAGDLVDVYAVEKGLSKVMNDTDGPDPLMNRTERLVHGEVANIIVNGLFSIFK